MKKQKKITPDNRPNLTGAGPDKRFLWTGWIGTGQAGPEKPIKPNRTGLTDFDHAGPKKVEKQVVFSDRTGQVFPEKRSPI